MGNKQKISNDDLAEALKEVDQGLFDANLGGSIFKKRISFEGKGKSGSGRTIVCYKKDDRAIFVHGFAKNEKSNISKKELVAFKELAKVLLNLSENEIEIALSSGALLEI